MMQGVDTQAEFMSFDRGRVSDRFFSLTVPGAAALVLSALAGAWLLETRPDLASKRAEAARPAAPVATAAKIKADPKLYGALFDPVAFGALFDPQYSSTTPTTFADSFPLRAALEPMLAADSPAPPQEPAEASPELAALAPQVDEYIPLPTPRPIDLRAQPSRGPYPFAPRRLAQQEKKSVVPTNAADTRSFFEKLFGVNKPTEPALAYAAPEGSSLLGGILGSGVRTAAVNASPGYDRWTAVYDVAGHTVYLPNGTRLEAHSGLGDRLDDPRHVNERNRGATPPNVYQLEPREALFHGVQALRLKPIGNGNLYGRAGLLAHTYMLGPNGDSNGCVSFKNYAAFLQAYQNGEIKRLVVVSSLN